MAAAKKLKAITVRRLEWIIEQLKKYPHNYDQTHFCGTQGCLAGYCLPVIAGNKLRFSGSKKDVVFRSFPSSEGLLPKDVKISFYPERTPGFEDTNLQFRAAAKYLRISGDQANRLFAAHWYGEAAQYNRRLHDSDRASANRAIRRVQAFISSNGEI